MQTRDILRSPTPRVPLPPSFPPANISIHCPKHNPHYSHRDMVVIATDHLSEKGATALRSDGWIVKRVKFVDNPGTASAFSGGFPKRFWGVYSKLNAWNLIEYKKVRTRQHTALYSSPHPRKSQPFNSTPSSMFPHPHTPLDRSFTSIQTRSCLATSTSCSCAPVSAPWSVTRSVSTRA